MSLLEDAIIEAATGMPEQLAGPGMGGEQVLNTQGVPSLDVPGMYKAPAELPNGLPAWTAGSSFFKPSPAEELHRAYMAAYARGESPGDLATGLPWAQAEPLYRNADTAAKNLRDTQRLKLFEIITKVDDPDLQDVMMQRLGLVPPPGPRQPPNVQGMSPTDALLAQQAYERGGQEEGRIGGKLRGELMKLRLAHELNAPEREANQMLRMLQAQVAMSNADANQEYKRALVGRGQGTMDIQRLGLLDNLMKSYRAEAGIGGNPQMAQFLRRIIEANFSDYQSGRAPTQGSGSAISAPSPNPLEPAPASPAPAPEQMSMAEEPQQLPWWDQAMPSTAAAPQVDPVKIAMLHQQLAHLKKFAPGDLAAQVALQKQIQDMVTPQINPRGIANMRGLPMPSGVKVTERK